MSYTTKNALECEKIEQSYNFHTFHLKLEKIAANATLQQEALYGFTPLSANRQRTRRRKASVGNSEEDRCKN